MTTDHRDTIARSIVRVQIIGDHPWSGFNGRLIAIGKPIFFGEPMGRVRLDDGQDCPWQHECYVESKNLRMEIDQCQ